MRTADAEIIAAKVGLQITHNIIHTSQSCADFHFLARDVIYTSRAYAMMPVRLSVRLSVTEVHWRIIANLGFKFRSHFTAHWPPCCCGRRAAGGRRAACVRISSRAMLASARFSCCYNITIHQRYRQTDNPP